MIPICEALQAILDRALPLEAEQIALTAAYGRILAEALHAVRDVPGFANAQMDGWALRSADVAGATSLNPRRLQITGRAAAGDPLPPRVMSGCAVRVFTGAPLPEGADAVVMQEVCRADATDTSVRVGYAPISGEFVRSADDDLAAGSEVLEGGRALGPFEVALLASLGTERLWVRRQPRVAIAVTGNELVPVGQPLSAGKIHDSNAWLLRGLVAEHGGTVVPLGIGTDEPAALATCLAAGLDCDILLTTGGVSVGDFDLVRPTLEGLGVEPVFWRVAQKPGKPLYFGMHGRTLVFGLPGNPVSAALCFLLHVAPALRRLGGRADVFAPLRQVRMAATVRSPEGVTEFIRCQVVEDGPVPSVRPAGTQSSAALSVLAAAEFLAVVPIGRSEVESGQILDALWIRPGLPWQGSFGLHGV